MQMIKIVDEAECRKYRSDVLFNYTEKKCAPNSKKRE